MNLIKLKRKRIIFRLITFLVITAFLCHDVAWAIDKNEYSLKRDTYLRDERFKNAFHALEIIRETMGDDRTFLIALQEWSREPDNEGLKARLINILKGVILGEKRENTRAMCLNALLCINNELDPKDALRKELTEFLEQNRSHVIKLIFGKDTIKEYDLERGFQQKTEEIRRRYFGPLDSSFHAQVMSQYKVLHLPYKPRDIEIMLTDRCPLGCRFCYSSSDPRGDKNLDVSRVFKDMPWKIDKCTISGGGEPLLRKDILSVIEQIPCPVDIVTNAIIFNTVEKAKNFLEKLKKKEKEKRPESIPFVFGVSLYKFHVEANPRIKKHIANFLEAIFDCYPCAKVSILYAGLTERRIEPLSLLESELQSRGYGVKFNKEIKSVIERKGNELTLTMTKGNVEKDIRIVVRYGLLRQGRAIFLPQYYFRPSAEKGKLKYVGVGLGSFSDELIIINPGGEVSFWDVLLADPVPFSFGNINTETWDVIEQRIRKDPIFNALNFINMEKLADIADEYDRGTVENLLKESGNEPYVFLYWLLINPERKLYITLRLLQEYLKDNPEIVKGKPYSEFMHLNQEELKEYAGEIIGKARRNYKKDAGKPEVIWQEADSSVILPSEMLNSPEKYKGEIEKALFEKGLLQNWYKEVPPKSVVYIEPVSGSESETNTVTFRVSLNGRPPFALKYVHQIWALAGLQFGFIRELANSLKGKFPGEPIPLPRLGNWTEIDGKEPVEIYSEEFVGGKYKDAKEFIEKEVFESIQDTEERSAAMNELDILVIAYLARIWYASLNEEGKGFIFDRLNLGDFNYVRNEQGTLMPKFFGFSDIYNGGDGNKYSGFTDENGFYGSIKRFYGSPGFEQKYRDIINPSENFVRGIIRGLGEEKGREFLKKVDYIKNEQSSYSNASLPSVLPPHRNPLEMEAFTLPEEKYGVKGVNIVREIDKVCGEILGAGKYFIGVHGSSVYMAEEGVVQWDKIGDIDLEIYIEEDDIIKERHLIKIMLDKISKLLEGFGIELFDEWRGEDRRVKNITIYFKKPLGIHYGVNSFREFRYDPYICYFSNGKGETFKDREVFRKSEEVVSFLSGIYFFMYFMTVSISGLAGEDLGSVSENLKKYISMAHIIGRLSLKTKLMDLYKKIDSAIRDKKEGDLNMDEIKNEMLKFKTELMIKDKEELKRRIAEGLNRTLPPEPESPGAAGTLSPESPGATGTLPPKSPGATGTLPPKSPGAEGALPPKSPGAEGALPPKSPGAAAGFDGGVEGGGGDLPTGYFPMGRQSRGFYKELADYFFEAYPPEHPANEYLRSVADPIIAKMFSEKAPRVYLVRSNDINARVFPDGTVCITDGLLRFIKYREELEFVLSHELIHYKRGHHKYHEVFNFSEYIASVGESRLKEIEADILSLINGEEIDVNPYGGIVFFRRLMEKTKKPGEVSLTHGSLINRAIQLLYPSRLFDIESMSATLAEVPANIKEGLMPEKSSKNNFEIIFSPKDKEMDSWQILSLNKERKRLVKELKSMEAVFYGIELVRERCRMFEKMKEKSKFIKIRYDDEMDIYTALNKILKTYMKKISGRGKKEGKKEIFTEAVLWDLGIGLNLNTEQEVGIAEEMAGAIEIKEDLDLLNNLLEEDIFLKRNLAIIYIPDNFVEFAAMEGSNVFMKESGFDMKGYSDFCRRLISALDKLYKRQGMKLDLERLFNIAVTVIIPTLREEHLEDVILGLFKDYKCEDKAYHTFGFIEMMGNLIRKIHSKKFIQKIVPLLSPNQEFTGVLQDLLLHEQDVRNGMLRLEGKESKEIESAIQKMREEVPWPQSYRDYIKGKSPEEIMKNMIYLNNLGIKMFTDFFVDPYNIWAKCGMADPFKIEDYFLIFLFTNDKDTLKDMSKRPALEDFSRLKNLLEFLYKPEKQRWLEKRYDSRILFNPKKDRDDDYSKAISLIIGNYFKNKLKDDKYDLFEFREELRYVCLTTGIDKNISLMEIDSDACKITNLYNEIISTALDKFNLLNMDSQEKAETLIYLSLYMPNKTAAFVMQDNALRYLGGIWDFDRLINFLEDLKKEQIGAINAIEEIIENKARTPDQIKKIQKKIRHSLEVQLPESEEFLEGLGKMSLFELIVNGCFKNKKAYRELLLCLTNPSNSQERLKRLCLELYIEWVLFLKNETGEDFDFDINKNKEELNADIDKWMETKLSDLFDEHFEYDPFNYPFYFVLKVGPQGIFRYFHSMDQSARYLVLHELLVGKYGILSQRDGPGWLVSQMFGNFIKDTEDPDEKERLRIAKEVLTGFAEETVSRNQYDILYFMIFPMLFERFLKSDGAVIEEQNFARLFPDIVTEGLKRSEKPKKEQKLIELLIEGAERRKGYTVEKDLIEKGFAVKGVTEKLNSVGLIIEAAQHLGAVGVRFLQLLGQYMDLPKEMEEEILKSYDRMIGQSKLAAFSILEKECPEIAKDIADMSPSIEGGSLRTTFILKMKDGRELIAKILNPNAAFRAELSINTLERVIECLCEKDPETYSAAKMLLPDLKKWIEEDIKSEMFREKDDDFRKVNISLQDTDWAKNSAYRVAVPNLVSCGPRHQIEEFIEGDNLTRWEKLKGEGHDMKEVISLITNHFFGQVEAGRLVHSDIHPGNFRVTHDSKIYILDRNYYIELTEKDKEFLFNLMAAQDAEALIDKIIDYLLDCPENKDKEADKELLKKNILEDLKRISKDELMNVGMFVNIILHLRKIELEIPLRMTLLMKNLQSLDRMAKKAGFKDIKEAYIYLFQKPKSPGAEGALPPESPGAEGALPPESLSAAGALPPKSPGAAAGFYGGQDYKITEIDPVTGNKTICDTEGRVLKVQDKYGNVIEKDSYDVEGNLIGVELVNIKNGRDRIRLGVDINRSDKGDFIKLEVLAINGEELKLVNRGLILFLLKKDGCINMEWFYPFHYRTKDEYEKFIGKGYGGTIFNWRAWYIKRHYKDRSDLTLNINSTKNPAVLDLYRKYVIRSTANGKEIINIRPISFTIEPDGRVVQYQEGKLIEIGYPDGKREVFRYNENGELAGIAILNSEREEILFMKYPDILGGEGYESKNKKLVERIKSGDESAKDEIIKLNMETVTKIINKYYKNYLKFFKLDELRGAGISGLLKAVDKYDPAKGESSSYYAWNKIRKAIGSYIKKEWKKRQTEINKPEDRHIREENEVPSGICVLEKLAGEKLKLGRIEKLLKELPMPRSEAFKIRYRLGEYKKSGKISYENSAKILFAKGIKNEETGEALSRARIEQMVKYAERYILRKILGEERADNIMRQRREECRNRRHAASAREKKWDTFIRSGLKSQRPKGMSHKVGKNGTIHVCRFVSINVSQKFKFQEVKVEVYEADPMKLDFTVKVYLGEELIGRSYLKLEGKGEKIKVRSQKVDLNGTIGDIRLREAIEKEWQDWFNRGLDENYPVRALRITVQSIELMPLEKSGFIKTFAGASGKSVYGYVGAEYVGKEVDIRVRYKGMNCCLIEARLTTGESIKGWVLGIDDRGRFYQKVINKKTLKKIKLSDKDKKDIEGLLKYEILDAKDLINAGIVGKEINIEMIKTKLTGLAEEYEKMRKSGDRNYDILAHWLVLRRLEIVKEYISRSAAKCRPLGTGTDGNLNLTQQMDSSV